MRRTTALRLKRDLNLKPTEADWRRRSMARAALGRFESLGGLNAAGTRIFRKWERALLRSRILEACRG